MKKYLVEYSSNNSGGHWWLKDKDWEELEKAGWLIVWASKSFDYKKGNYKYDKKGLPKLKDVPDNWASQESGVWRYLGAIAKYAFKRFDSIKEALEEFEKVTSADVSDEGCDCCGAPHSFSWKDKNGKGDYCSGEDCLKYMYDKVPSSLREACR